MKAVRAIKRSLRRLIPFGMIALSAITPDVSHGGSAFIAMDDIVTEIQAPRHHARKHSHNVMVADADEKPEGQICVDCARETLRKKQAPVRSEARPAAAAEPEVKSSSLDEKLGLIAFRNAVKPRRMAHFMSRSRAFRSGNVGKGMCAQATKETLVEAGVCASYPQGNAYALEGLSALVRSCGQHVRRLSIKDPRQAPKNSVIIYAGYAGHRPHKFGHVENKIVVTAALKRKYANDSVVRGSRVGQFLYCSDFCKIKPTMTPHNPVAAIYEMI